MYIFAHKFYGDKSNVTNIEIGHSIYIFIAGW